MASGSVYMPGCVATGAPVATLTTARGVGSLATTAVPLGTAPYGGAYGGSFCSPTGQRSSSMVPAPIAYPSTYSGAGPPLSTVGPITSQPAPIRRLNSQSSTASLSMQPPFVQSLSTSVSRGLPASARVAGGEVLAADPNEVLLQTRVVRNGVNDDHLQAEVFTLRSTVSAQEEKNSQLSRQLQVSQENERKLVAELEVARGDIGRLSEELRSERLLRQQAEATAAELRVAGDLMSTPGAAGQDITNSRQNNSASRLRGSTRAPSATRRSESAPRTRPAERPQSAARPQTPTSAAGNASVGTGLASSRRASAQPQSAKDEIDGRLREYLERSDCGLLFRRMNRGWYSFRVRGDRGPVSNDRSVEISIVNGKLMARLEPSTHDAGWNNGKLGTIERFAASMCAA